MGWAHDGLTDLTEAVTLQRGLAEREPDRYTPNLATFLTNLATVLLQLGRREEALACHGEATAHWARLAHRRPDAFDEGYQRQRAALARFCTKHNYPNGAAIRAENDATHALDLRTEQSTNSGPYVQEPATMRPGEDTGSNERRTTGSTWNHHYDQTRGPKTR
ncbi:tetratricopeptide repeat protein [Pseudonocardia saturnea]